MRSQLFQWWQHYKRFIVIALLFIGFIVGGYVFHWTWTGFVTQPSPPNTQLTKTLWDWMSLLIIPIILALVGVFFTRSERKNEQALADQRTKDEQAISRDNQQEAALQGYLDRMSELLLEKHLRESKQGDEVRNVARVRTLTMFYQLNTRRTNYMLAFLRESGLVAPDIDTTIVTFSEADLRSIDLKEINLSKLDLSSANLSSANLREADLSEARLNFANLSLANLSEAILSEAILNKADLREAILSEANLNKADLGEADLGEANLNKANLRGANLCEADLRGANLCEADLREADLREADLRGADLNGATLSGANFKDAIMNQASLNTAKLTQEQHATIIIDIT